MSSARIFDGLVAQWCDATPEDRESFLGASPDEWRSVAGYEGNYEVSSSGAVRKTSTGYVMRPFKTDRGYLIVKLFQDGKGTNYKVHRLVATAFIRPPIEGEQVNHKDLDKANNHVENLEWVTCQGNMDHFLAARPDFLQSRQVLTPEDIEKVRSLYSQGYGYLRISRLFGVGKTTISVVVANPNYGIPRADQHEVAS